MTRWTFFAPYLTSQGSTQKMGWSRPHELEFHPIVKTPQHAEEKNWSLPDSLSHWNCPPPSNATCPWWIKARDMLATGISGKQTHSRTHSVGVAIVMGGVTARVGWGFIIIRGDQELPYCALLCASLCALLFYVLLPTSRVMSYESHPSLSLFLLSFFASCLYWGYDLGSVVRLMVKGGGDFI